MAEAGVGADRKCSLERRALWGQRRQVTARAWREEALGQESGALSMNTRRQQSFCILIELIFRVQV